LFSHWQVEIPITPFKRDCKDILYPQIQKLFPGIFRNVCIPVQLARQIEANFDLKMAQKQGASPGCLACGSFAGGRVLQGSASLRPGSAKPLSHPFRPPELRRPAACGTLTPPGAALRLLLNPKYALENLLRIEMASN
jgi:hypothetical protein